MLGWIDTLLQGILLGGLYSLYATGLSVIFGIMRLVNLAHGDLIVLAAFLMLALTAVGVIVLLNGVFYRTALGRAFRATSDDVEIAQLMGINNKSIYALTMGIALAVCA